MNNLGNVFFTATVLGNKPATQPIIVIDSLQEASSDELMTVQKTNTCTVLNVFGDDVEGVSGVGKVVES